MNLAIGAAAGLDPGGIAVVAIGLFLAGVIKGTTGLGYATCALPFLVHAMGLKAGMAMVLLPAMATNIAMALGNGYLASTWRMFGPLYLALLPGVAAGLMLLRQLQTPTAVLLLGITIIGYVVFALARPRVVMPWRIAAGLLVPIGLANGVLTGLTGSQVMPMVPYFLASGLAMAQVVQAINLGVLIASAALLAGLNLAAAVPRDILALSVLAIAPALAGVAIGQRLQQRFSSERLRIAILVVLGVAGAALIARAWPYLA